MQTDERTENLPILQDFVPYRGKCTADQILTLVDWFLAGRPSDLAMRPSDLNIQTDGKSPHSTGLLQSLTEAAALLLQRKLKSDKLKSSRARKLLTT